MAASVSRISELLAGRGHAVTVATGAHAKGSAPAVNGVDIVRFDLSGNMVDGFAGDTAAYLRFLQDSSFDIMVFFAAQQWATDLALPILARLKAPAVLVPVGFSRLRDPRYGDYYVRMSSWMRQVRTNVFLSETYQDTRFARENGILNAVVIPNGASESEFTAGRDARLRRRLGIPRSSLLVLSVSSHLPLKGHSETIKVFRAAALRNSVLLLAGNAAGKECLQSCRAKRFVHNLNPSNFVRRTRIMLRDLIRQDIVAAFHAADLFLFTSRIECSPLVLFESLAGATPFLCTDVGNAAEIAQWTGGGIILPSIRTNASQTRALIGESAKVLRELAADSGRRARMAASGNRAWKEHFTWEKLAVHYEEVYRACIAGTQTSFRPFQLLW
jgi:glycosyltransferase involved in cell wall biosynthesis